MGIRYRNSAQHVSTPEALLVEALFGEAAKAGQDIFVDRNSPREFDLHLDGSGSRQHVGFGAWLPLAAIHALDGKRLERAFAMSDYPGMAGDWSAIRDSQPDTIWWIFNELVRPTIMARRPPRGTRTAVPGGQGQALPTTAPRDPGTPVQRAEAVAALLEVLTGCDRCYGAPDERTDLCGAPGHMRARRALRALGLL
jgi:hypothetical protein